MSPHLLDPNLFTGFISHDDRLEAEVMARPSESIHKHSTASEPEEDISGGISMSKGTTLLNPQPKEYTGISYRYMVCIALVVWAGRRIRGKSHQHNATFPLGCSRFNGRQLDPEEKPGTLGRGSGRVGSIFRKI